MHRMPFIIYLHTRIAKSQFRPIAHKFNNMLTKCLVLDTKMDDEHAPVYCQYFYCTITLYFFQRFLLRLTSGPTTHCSFPFAVFPHRSLAVFLSPHFRWCVHHVWIHLRKHLNCNSAFHTFRLGIGSWYCVQVMLIAYIFE